MRHFVKLALTASTLICALAAGHRPAGAIEKGDWLLRVRGLALLPNDSSGGIKPDLPTARVGVGTDLVPEVDITHMLTDYLGLELIAATSRHDLKGKKGISALGKIADTWVLPPTLTLQLHPFPKAPIRPYAGVGINYTLFFEEKTTASLKGALGPTTIDLDDSVGFAAQGGVDIDIGKGWFLNLDFKYIRIDTQATLRSAGMSRRVDVDIHPIIFGVGIGFRF